MGMQIKFGNVVADVTKKDIKNIHLSVYPPTGAVRISAPTHMSLDTIRVFALSKLNWIRKQQDKLGDQIRETPREFLNRESHYLWGKRYLLEIIEKDEKPAVELKHSTIIMQVRPNSNEFKKSSVLEEWYRQKIKAEISQILQSWEVKMGVDVDRFIVQKMKTKWGSCTPQSSTIRLNLELAKKPRQCLEYIVVHELLHLIEPTHNSRFISLMDQFLPRWRLHRDDLNRLPLAHEDWKY